ncbi:MAG: hypothetical protein EKK55_22525 [Rhodocyclaceae bacterium]|nr:MAG: hypothetical protein EKK55_22525 [Rhodocyclaceae bacterium]
MSYEYSFAWDFPADCYRIRINKQIRDYPIFSIFDVSSIKCHNKEGESAFLYRLCTVHTTPISINRPIETIEFDVYEGSQYPITQRNAAGFLGTAYQVKRTSLSDQTEIIETGIIRVDVIFLGRRKQYIEVTDFFGALEKMLQRYKDTQ